MNLGTVGLQPMNGYMRKAGGCLPSAPHSPSPLCVALLHVIQQHQVWSLCPSMWGQSWVWPCTRSSSLQLPEVEVMLCHGIWHNEVSWLSGSVRKFPIQVFKSDTLRTPYNHFLNKMHMFATTATEKPLLCKSTSGQLLTWTGINP